MSTATTINSPGEYIQSLSPDAKQRVFLQLLREAWSFHGDADLMPVDDEDGRSLGYFVSPKAAARHSTVPLPDLSPEELEATAAALATLHDTFDPVPFIDEVLAKSRPS
jgi:hypothetical protein